ncbi:Xanthine phosphoribosyltransferase 1 [Entomortierella beljakovae]|nr:Xanthine phosphoribosyltransferase 1 [Entomortierella beljakovae]
MTASDTGFLRLCERTFRRNIKKIIFYIIIFCIFINAVVYLSINAYTPPPRPHNLPLKRLHIVIPNVLRSGRPNPLSVPPPKWIDDWISKRILDPEVTGNLSEGVNIDLIYTWVNGSEPELQEVKEHYKGLSLFFKELKNITSSKTEKPDTKSPENNDKDASKHRFRDNGELKYSVRSVAQYGGSSVIRKSFILATEVIDKVTGQKRHQTPSWLDQEKARGALEVVPHSKIYDNNESLPSFNSLSIESQMHHVPGLADIFVYLNDDVFFGKKINMADFWTPVYGFVFHLSTSTKVNSNILNSTLTSSNVDEAPSLEYTNAILSMQFGHRRRAYLAHIPHILSVPIMDEIQAIWPKEFDKTSSHRFRGEGYGQEIQVSFFLAHYVVERLRETQLSSYWKYHLDKNQDGMLDWEERKELLNIIERYQEVKRRRLRGHFGTKPLSILDNHNILLQSVGIPGTTETEYLMSGMDEYPFTLGQPDSPPPRHQGGRKGVEMNSFTNLPRTSCKFSVEYCLGDQFTDSSHPAINAALGKGSLFEQVAFTDFQCGDCLLHILREFPSNTGASWFLPPDKNSLAYKEVLSNLAKYNYVVGTSRVLFLQLKDGAQAEAALENLMKQKNTTTYFCINDDVQDNRLIERRVNGILSGFLEKRLPNASPWENPSPNRNKS